MSERILSTERPLEENRIKRIAGAIFHIGSPRRKREEWPAWVDDPQGYWPVHDRAGAMSEYQGGGDGGMLGVHARIDFNIERGKDPMDGLPEDALTPKL